MKKSFSSIIIVAILLIVSCNSQSDAQNKAKEISAATQLAEGDETPSATGGYLLATINGKRWEATSLGPYYGPESNYKLVSGKTKEYWINFQIHKPVTGMEREFGNENVADFSTEEEFYSGKKGKVIITKADDQWIEGTFYFTATSTDYPKTFEVTDGKFRIPVNIPKP